MKPDEKPANDVIEKEEGLASSANGAGGGVGKPPVDTNAPGTSPSGAPPDQPQQSPLAQLASEFASRTDDMRRAAKITMNAIGAHFKAQLDECLKTISPHIDEKETDSFTVRMPDDIRERTALIAALTEYTRLHKSKMGTIVERSLFIGLFSEFDAFIGNLLTIIYEKQPELLKSVKREVTLAELLEFDTLDAAKKDMLEKEIDSFRRESYVEQFSLLENKFGLKTLKKFPEWQEFVEIGQRRNLMTHNDGIISEQYLGVCKKEGCQLDPKLTAGETLTVGASYYFRACHVLSLVAFMLVYTLWRKVLPAEAEIANKHIRLAVYDALRRKNWRLAASMGAFSLSPEMQKGADDLNIRIRSINLAIAYKKSKKPDECLKVLTSCDWTASIRDFKLAVAVLKDEYEKAADLMRQIGKSGELVHQGAYHDWPLFSEFRDRDEFCKAYLDVYGHDYHAKLDEEPDALTVPNRLPNIAAEEVLDTGTDVATPPVETDSTASEPALRKKPRPRLKSVPPKSD